jgi:hypothetical protein
MQGLPASLTRLKFEWGGSGMLGLEAASSISQLTTLQSLHLESDHITAHISPALVQQMRQLTELRMTNVVGDEGSLLMLLGALQSMQQLQHLELHFADDVYPLEDEEMQQYAALTASSQLTCFKLLEDNDAVAYGAAQYMFAEGKQLPHLKQLHMGCTEAACYSAEWTADDEPLKPFAAGDLARLAAACPALEQFWAMGAVQSSAEIIDLTKLTNVTQLKIGGEDVDGPQLAAALAEMEQLRDLTVMNTPSFAHAELAALTSLTLLRRLKVFNCEKLQGELEDVDIDSKVRML